MINAISYTARILCNWVYPPRCAGCGRWGAVVLCPACAGRLERADPEALRVQLASWPAVHQVWDGAYALWRYSRHGTVRQLQHRLKYRNQPWLGVALGRLLGVGYRAHLQATGAAPDLLVPMPLSRVRYLERGYNQSLMLARGMAEVLDCPVGEGVLVRARATRAQAQLSKAARLANVSGAFHVPHPDSLAGRTVVLVDDVLTTGATLLAAAHPLREAGATHIDLVTLAFAD